MNPERSTYSQNLPRWSGDEVRNGLSMFKLISGNGVLVGDADSVRTHAQIALQQSGGVLMDLKSQLEMLQDDPNAFSPYADLQAPVYQEVKMPSRFGVEPNKFSKNTFIGRYTPNPEYNYDELTTDMLGALNITPGSIVRVNFDIKSQSGLDETPINSRNIAFEEDHVVFEVESGSAKYNIKFSGVMGSMKMQVFEEKPVTPEFIDGEQVVRGIIFNAMDGPTEDTGTEMILHTEVADSETNKAISNVALALVENVLFEKHTIIVRETEDRRLVR